MVNDAKEDKDSAKQDADGVVVKVLPGTRFLVRITDPNLVDPASTHEYIVEGYIAGKMRMNFIRIIPGDRVRIQIDSYDPQKGRITFRYK